jgi:hypothetical protein
LEFTRTIAYAACPAPVRWLAILLFMLGSLCGEAGSAEAQAPSGAGATPGGPPVIQNFAAVHLGGNTWAVHGQVFDIHAWDVEVYFGGLLQGVSVMTNADGSFSWTFDLPPGATGDVTAIAVDDRGLVSNEADYFIRN